MTPTGTTRRDVAPNQAPLIPEPYRLLHLHVGWNGQIGEFPWSKATDGLKAVLPFGECRVSFTEDQTNSAVRVEVSLITDRGVRLDALEVRYHATAGKPDYLWAPYLQPRPGDVIADQVFRSPVLFAEADGQTAALVPDLQIWPDGFETYLDLKADDHGQVRFAHGIGHWRVRGHVFFKKKRGRMRLPAGTITTFAHYLLREPTLGGAASFVWQRHARRHGVLPQVLGLDRYQQLALDRIFAPDLFHRFAWDGHDVAGMVTQTVTSKRRPKLMNERGVDRYLANQSRLLGAMRLIQTTLFLNPVGYELLTAVLHNSPAQNLPMVSFGCWFNQVRTALGSALAARRLGRDDLVEAAALIVELALNLPDDEGCWPSVCLFPEGHVRFKRGTRAFEMIDAFHLPDAAVTGFHLLEWHERVTSDERILTRCLRLAEFFLARQEEGGTFPSWVSPRNGDWDVDPILRRSAATAAPAMFLARLHRVSPEPRFFDAASAALRFIEREVLPEDKWFDYELLYSCAGRPTGQDGPDPRTGTFPMNTLSMYWAAQACLDLHLADPSAGFLELGRRILDRLSLFQQVFDHPRLSADTFGGFAVMNADGEFNDARQGLFVPLYFAYYRATGDAELAERAVATLRACFMTMLVEDHQTVAPGNLKRFRPADRGAILENYGHNGRDAGPAGYLSPDWGCGTSLYGAGLALQDIGQVFVDVARGFAIGVDGCRARLAGVENRTATVVITGSDSGALDVVVDDADNVIEKVMIVRQKKDSNHEWQNRPGTPSRFRRSSV